MQVKIKPYDECLELIIDVWNKFREVENKHPDDDNDFRFHIHALQNLLYAHKYKVEVPGSGMYGGFRTWIPISKHPEEDGRILVLKEDNIGIFNYELKHKESLSIFTHWQKLPSKL